MKKWMPIVFILLLIVGAMWFWSLGSLPVENTAKATIVSVDGDVKVKAAGASDGQKVQKGAEIAEGSTVQTGADGRVTVGFFDRSEASVGENSEVIIDEAKGSAVRLKVIVGRVWSRVSRLLDLDSAYLVETNDVVATVRGTSFEVAKAKDQTEVTTFQSVVDGSPMNGKTKDEMPVPEGRTSRFGKGLPVVSVDVTDDRMKEAWVLKNREADKAFALAVRTRFGQGGTEGLPNAIVEQLTRASEALHVAWKRGDGPSLCARYAERRLYQIVFMAQSGQEGAAQAAFASWEDEVRRKMNGSDAWRAALKPVFARAMTGLAEVEARSPAYRFKQKLEDDYVETAARFDERLYARLITMDARLDEASAALDTQDTKTAASALDVAEQGLSNIERDLKETKEEISAEHRQTLTRKRVALSARLTIMRKRLAKAAVPAKEGVTMPIVPLIEQPTSTKLTVVSSPTSTFSCVSIDVLAQPNPAMVGGRSVISIRAVREDKTTVDATVRASLKVFGGLGSLTKNVFIAKSPGSVQIEATVLCDGKPVAGSVSLQINQPLVQLKSLTVSVSPSTMDLGGRAVASALATYTDGSTKDVTSLVKFVSNDGNVAITSGNIVQSAQVAGTASINATYAENGVSVSGGGVVTVMAGKF